MKSIIFVFALLTIAYGSYKEKCNANAACEAVKFLFFFIVFYKVWIELVL